MHVYMYTGRPMNSPCVHVHRKTHEEPLCSCTQGDPWTAPVYMYTGRPMKSPCVHVHRKTHEEPLWLQGNFFYRLVSSCVHRLSLCLCPLPKELGTVAPAGIKFLKCHPSHTQTRSTLLNPFAVVFFAKKKRDVRRRKERDGRGKKWGMDEGREKQGEWKSWMDMARVKARGLARKQSQSPGNLATALP